MKSRKRKYTVMLPQDLVAKAMESTGQTLTPVLQRGLELVAREGAYEKARAMKGKMKFSVDFQALREADEK